LSGGGKPPVDSSVPASRRTLSRHDFAGVHLLTRSCRCRRTLADDLCRVPCTVYRVACMLRVHVVLSYRVYDYYSPFSMNTNDWKTYQLLPIHGFGIYDPNCREVVSRRLTLPYRLPDVLFPDTFRDLRSKLSGGGKPPVDSSVPASRHTLSRHGFAGVHLLTRSCRRRSTLADDLCRVPCTVYRVGCMLRVHVACSTIVPCVRLVRGIFPITSPSGSNRSVFLPMTPLFP
jgi:hypothetical protein